MASERTRNSLNENQKQLLTLLYKFRYVTIPLLTEYKALKSNSIQRTLDILLDKKLVDRQWDKSFIKAEMPAIYFLTKQGVAPLRKDERFNPAVLNTFYRNSKASQGFIQHKLDTLKVFLALKSTYGDTFQIFTQQELQAFEEFPEKKPDLFLRARDNSKEYFITLAQNTQPYLYRKRLKELIRHYDEEGWNNGEYPTLLFVLADSGQEMAFLKFFKKSLEDEGLDDDELKLATTTLKAQCQKPYVQGIWTYNQLGDDPRSL